MTKKGRGTYPDTRDLPFSLAPTVRHPATAKQPSMWLSLGAKYCKDWKFDYFVCFFLKIYKQIKTSRNKGNCKLKTWERPA